LVAVGWYRRFKGAHLVDGSDEKRLIGEKWQAASDGQAIYVFLEKECDGMDVRQQLLKALGKECWFQPK
jgi:type III restriction enzyme